MGSRTLNEIKSEINKMVEDRRATKLINPALTLFYLREFERTGNRVVDFSMVKQGYEEVVCDLIRNRLHHNFNIGGQFNDTYLQRLASRHHVLEHVRGNNFALTEDFVSNYKFLTTYVIDRIQEHLHSKLGNLARLYRVVNSNAQDEMTEILEDSTSTKLRQFLKDGFEGTSQGFLDIAYGFEICMFAILKVLLAKFGCKIYRDSKTYSSDKGTDFSTNFGIVYQVKKKCITNEKAFDDLVSDLLLSFADGRIQEGNVFVVVEDVDDGYRKRLDDRNINCISKKMVIDFLDKLSPEEKWEVLKQVVQEFKRELVSYICRNCKKPDRANCFYYS